jgi:hypothetical protein
MKKLIAVLLCLLSTMDSKANKNDTTVQLINLSQQLLLAVKTNSSTGSFVQIIAAMPYKELQVQLVTDNDKKAFWINIYNAYTQLLLTTNPDKYRNKNQFFKDKQIPIAGEQLSLDDIEHGILRKSKVKWSLGYLNNLFPSPFEKLNRVEHVDYRIHFALNCGATSCPPIAFYSPEKLDRQLDLATQSYLGGEAVYKVDQNIIYLPAIMSWFRGDFGGKKNMIRILKQHKIIAPDKHPTVRFKTYDWKLSLSNYKNGAI